MTPQAAAFLRFLRDWYRTHDHGPSFQQAADALGLASRSSIARYLRVLEPLGYVERAPGRHREVRVTAKGLAAIAEPAPPAALDDALREMTKANGCTDAEAEAAMAAAARLMKEHGLSAEALDMEREGVPTTSRSTVLDQLWATIAALTGCVPVKDYTSDGWRFQYIGRQPGPAVAAYLHTYLARHIELAVRQYQETREYKRKKKGTPRRRACEAFRDGMVKVLRRTVHQHFDRPEPAAIEAAERYRDSLYSNLREIEPREVKTRHENARLAGAGAGAGIEIRTGLGGGPAGLIGRE